MMSLLPKIREITEKLNEIESKEVYSIFKYFIDTVIVTNSKGEIEFVNDSVESLFGYKANDLKNKNVSMLIYGEKSIEKHSDYISKLLFTSEKLPVCFGRFVDGKDVNGKLVRLYLYVTEFRAPEKHYIAILHKV